MTNLIKTDFSHWKRPYADWIAGQILFSLLFLFFFLPVWPAHGAEKPDIPIPDWMETTRVADQMMIQGRLCTVVFFTADKSSDTVMTYYREKWRQGHSNRPGFREANFGDWHIISRLENRYLLTVQVRNQGPFLSTGYLAVTDLGEKEKQSTDNKEVPKMSGSRIINDLTSYDPGQRARTLLITNRYSIESNTDFYRNYYKERGWGTLLDAGHDEGQALAFGKGGKEAHLVITSRSGTTRVVMNIVKKD